MADYSPWLEDMIKLLANISDVTAQNSNQGVNNELIMDINHTLENIHSKLERLNEEISEKDWPDNIKTIKEKSVNINYNTMDIKENLDKIEENTNVKLDTILENQNNINDTLLEIAEINKILSEILFKLNNTLSNIDYNLETKKNTTSTLNISDKTVDNNTEDN